MARPGLRAQERPKEAPAQEPPSSAQQPEVLRPPSDQLVPSVCLSLPEGQTQGGEKAAPDLFQGLVQASTNMGKWVKLSSDIKYFSSFKKH